MTSIEVIWTVIAILAAISLNTAVLTAQSLGFRKRDIKNLRDELSEHMYPKGDKNRHVSKFDIEYLKADQVQEMRYLTTRIERLEKRPVVAEKPIRKIEVVQLPEEKK